MTDNTTAALADNKEIRAGFELCYATDADDPANVTDLGHFTNGWRACIISQLRAPVADERAKTALRTIAEYPVPEQDNMPARNMRAVAVAALASAPVAGEAQPNIMRFNPFAGLGMNPAPNGMYVRYEDHAAMLSRYTAPQASEAVRNAAPTTCAPTDFHG